MQILVQCAHCPHVYDLTTIKVIQRYADATVFESPCCMRHVDDRPWKGTPDFRRLDRDAVVDQDGKSVTRMTVAGQRSVRIIKTLADERDDEQVTLDKSE